MSTPTFRIGDVAIYDWIQKDIYRYVGIVFGAVSGKEDQYWVHFWCEGQELIRPMIIKAADLIYVGSIMDFNLGVTRVELAMEYMDKARD